MNVKKSILLLIIMLFILTGCTNDNISNDENINNNIVNSEIETPLISEESKTYTAEDIVNILKEKNANIGKIITFNEENDPNELLGRPNQYISKTSFEDIRLNQPEGNVFGGTVEVFKTNEDMINRKTYVEEVGKTFSFALQYCYGNETILLRVESELTPSQAKEYEDAFNSIFE